jgi:hypothetical protein
MTGGRAGDRPFVFVRLRSVMAKSAGWAAGGALVSLALGIALAGHPVRAFAWFTGASLAEGFWIGAIGIRPRMLGLRQAAPCPPGAGHRPVPWHSSPILPLVVVSTALAGLVAVKRRPELVGLCAGVDGGFALAFALIARLYDVQERRKARRYWAPGRGLGGPVHFTPAPGEPGAGQRCVRNVLL